MFAAVLQMLSGGPQGELELPRIRCKAHRERARGGGCMRSARIQLNTAFHEQNFYFSTSDHSGRKTVVEYLSRLRHIPAELVLSFVVKRFLAVLFVLPKPWLRRRDRGGSASLVQAGGEAARNVSLARRGKIRAADFSQKSGARRAKSWARRSLEKWPLHRRT